MIYYDMTDVLEYARHNSTVSGVQRFSIQMLSHIVNKHGADLVRIIAFLPSQNKLSSFDASFFRGEYIYNRNQFLNYFMSDDIDAYIRKKYRRKARRVVQRARLVLANKLSGGATFRKRNIALPHTGHVSAAHFLSQDIVFIGGTTWGFERYTSLLANERRSRGFRLYHYIHDIIPIVAPEHVGDGTPQQFSRWLTQISEICDVFLTNSAASKRDLDKWLADRGANIHTKVVPLAHQFAGSARPKGRSEIDWHSVQARVRNAAHLPFVLCVGTIETRKNVWTLANVWKRIHAKMGYDTPRLIFAGKRGALNGDFNDFIRGTGSLDGYIRVVDRPTDVDLAFLYQNCLFSMFPSYIEGWGLPIGEGLWFGRPVIASNTSSMPEVGGDLVDYIDPRSPQSIEDAAMRMITDVTYRERRAAQIAAAQLRTWPAVADDLWGELTAFHAKHSHSSLDRAPLQRQSEMSAV
jgi:glycosyltransferase involved in cell wall biosynthesis